MARKQKQSLLKKTDPLGRDLFIVDKIFSPLRNEGVSLISGWSNRSVNRIDDWQQEENRQLSEQRGQVSEIYLTFSGSLERFIGHVVCRFAV